MLPSEQATEVVKDRQKQYGHPSDVYLNVSMLWGVYLGAPVNAVDVATMLLLLKVGREMTKHGPDNLVDIAGYANVLAMIRGEEDVAREESG